MDVHKIVKKYLEDNGYDGLYSPGECACCNADLFPCGSEGVESCEPGYFIQKNSEDFNPDFDFTIGPDKKGD